MSNKYRDVNAGGLALIKLYEGCRQKAYRLEGEKYYTIGYGHSFDSSINANTVWTQEKCEEMLRQDLDNFEGYTVGAVTNIKPTDNQFGALVSYCYNRGLGATDCHNGLRQLVANSKTATEYAENFLKYWGTATTYKKGLLERRNAERKLFLTGTIETETNLSTCGLTDSQIKSNIVTVQKWLNSEYGDYITSCKLCGNKLLTVDGKIGNGTRAGLTIALHVFLNTLGANLKVDGDYGTATNNAVKKLLAVKDGTANVSAKIVQAILQCYGYNPQLFYNKFNGDCVEALKLCQVDHNLNDDGVAGVIFFSTFIKQR
jgi:lysozyme